MSQEKIRLSCSLQTQVDRYKNNKNLAFPLKLREDLNNGIAHGAKRFDIVTVRFDEISLNPLVAVMHDGEPWNNINEMFTSLRVSTSLGAGGCQGFGAKAAACTLVKRMRDFALHFLSRVKETNQFLHAMLYMDSDELKIKAVNPKVTEGFLSVLGSLVEGHNVIYLSPYEPVMTNFGPARFSSFQNMTTLSDLICDLNDVKVQYWPYLELSKDKKYDQIVAGDEKERRNFLRPFFLRSRQSYDTSFMDSQYEFAKIPVTVNAGSKRIRLIVSLIVKIYSGLRLSDGDGDNRYGLIALLGSDKFRTKADGWQPYHTMNTFVTSSCHAKLEPLYHRLGEEPHFVGNLLNELNISTNTKIFSKTEDFFDCEKQLDASGKHVDSPWLEFFQENSKQEKKGVVKRTPFAKLLLDITDIEEVTDLKTGKVEELLPSELRSLLGGVEENFMTQDGRVIRKIIEKSFDEINKNRKYQDTLRDLRQRCEVVFPVRFTDLIEIELPQVRKDSKLKVFDGETNVKVTKVKAEIGKDQDLYVNLVDESGSLINPKDHDFAIYDLGKEILDYSQIKTNNNSRGGFRITISALRYFDDTTLKFVEAESEDEWLENSNQFRSLPNKEVRIYCRKKRKEYLLNLKVELPVRERNYTGDSKPQKERKENTIIKEYAKKLDPPEAVVHFNLENGLLTINNEHPLILFFMQNTGYEAFGQSLYNELTEFCQSVAKDVVPNVTWDQDPQNKEVRQRWNDNYEYYMINCFVVKYLDNRPEIWKKITEIKAKIGNVN